MIPAPDVHPRVAGLLA